VTNTQRIIEALRRNAGLDDDDLSKQTGVRPRQQVNQICRRLEARGVLSRVRGEEGKILNVLNGTAQVENPRATSDTESQNSVLHLKSPSAPKITNWTLGTHDRQSTLFVLCCSGSKSADSLVASGPSILDCLPDPLTKGLREARRVVAPLAKLDESTLLPAWRRYSGQLYQAAAQVIGRAVLEDVNVVIVSGGYGLLLADERIGLYDRRFRCNDWPSGLLERVLVAFVEHNGIKAVRAFASATSDYERLLRRVPWKDAQIEDVWLLTPETSQGAMVKSPRAQGEAFAALFDAALTDSWHSSDGLAIDGMRLA
jgi:hypothetical protein